MIFGIESRTIHFRVVRMKKRIVLVAFYSGLGATVSALLAALPDGALMQSLLLDSGSVLFLASGAAFIIGVSAFRDNALTDHLKRMNERDRRRYLYFNRAFRISVSWLVLALFLALIYSFYSRDGSNQSLFWIRDAFIHSMAVGFIASAVAAYSPILLPAVISGKALHQGLSNVPLYVVTVGNIWRVGSDVASSLSISTTNLFTGYSGILIIIGMLWFVIMNHHLK